MTSRAMEQPQPELILLDEHANHPVGAEEVREHLGPVVGEDDPPHQQQQQQQQQQDQEQAQQEQAALHQVHIPPPVKKKQKFAHNKVVQIQCELCKVILNSKAAYKYHTQKQVCLKKNKRKSLGAHQQPVYKCPDCGVVLKSDKALKYHINQSVCKKRSKAQHLQRRDHLQQLQQQQMLQREREQHQQQVVVPQAHHGEDSSALRLLQAVVTTRNEDSSAEIDLDGPPAPPPQPTSGDEKDAKLPGMVKVSEPKPCPYCGKVLNSAGAYKYHVNKQVCRKANKSGYKSVVGSASGGDDVGEGGGELHHPTQEDLVEDPSKHLHEQHPRTSSLSSSPLPAKEEHHVNVNELQASGLGGFDGGADDPLHEANFAKVESDHQDGGMLLSSVGGRGGGRRSVRTSATPDPQRKQYRKHRLTYLIEFDRRHHDRINAVCPLRLPPGYRGEDDGEQDGRQAGMGDGHVTPYTRDERVVLVNCPGSDATRETNKGGRGVGPRAADVAGDDANREGNDGRGEVDHQDDKQRRDADGTNKEPSQATTVSVSTLRGARLPGVWADTTATDQVLKASDELEFLLYTEEPVWKLSFHPGFESNGQGDEGVSDTFLAVATRSSNARVHLKGKTYSGANAIQVWRLPGNDASSQLPELVVALQHDGDAAWAVEWHPSPVNREQGKRTNTLGFLACVLGDGTMRVVRVPWVEAAKREPVQVQLESLEVVNSRNEPVLSSTIANSLAWYPAAPYNRLAVGLDDGTVAVWEFGADTVQFLILMCPSRCFTAHQLNSRAGAACAAVMNVAWCPDDPNMVACTTSDNTALVWDIRLPQTPCMSKFFKKLFDARLSDLAWLQGADTLLVGDEIGRLHFVQLLDLKGRPHDFHLDAVNQMAANHRAEPGLTATCSSDGYVKVHICRKLFTHYEAGKDDETGRPLVKTHSGFSYLQKKTNSPNGYTMTLDRLIRTGDGTFEIDTSGVGMQDSHALWKSSQHPEQPTVMNVNPASQRLRSVCWGRGGATGTGSWLAWGGDDGIIRVSYVVPCGD